MAKLSKRQKFRRKRRLLNKVGARMEQRLARTLDNPLAGFVPRRFPIIESSSILAVQDIEFPLEETAICENCGL